MSYELHIDDDGKARTEKLAGHATVGQSNDCDITIDSPQCPSRAIAIVMEDDAVEVFVLADSVEIGGVPYHEGQQINVQIGESFSLYCVTLRLEKLNLQREYHIENGLDLKEEEPLDSAAAERVEDPLDSSNDTDTPQTKTAGLDLTTQLLLTGILLVVCVGGGMMLALGDEDPPAEKMTINTLISDLREEPGADWYSSQVSKSQAIECLQQIKHLQAIGDLERARMELLRLRDDLISDPKVGGKLAESDQELAGLPGETLEFIVSELRAMN